MRVLLTALLLASALAVFALPSVSGFVGSAYACDEPEKGNNGWGNGDQSAPGNSRDNNNAENGHGSQQNHGSANQN